MSRCLVTGGAGFVGSHLVDGLLSAGHNVSVVDNESSQSHDEFHWNDNAKNFKENLCDYSKTVAVFREEKPEYVFHLAADSNIQVAIENPKQTLENNFSSTVNLLDCARLYKTKRVIFSSSASVYGSHRPPQEESLKTDPLNAYAMSKVMGEKAMKLYYKIYGLETVCLRYFNIYGERQPIRGAYASVIGAFLAANREGRRLKVYGDGLQERDFVYVRDVAVSNISSAFSENKRILGNILNVGTGKSHTVLEIANLISDKINFCPQREGEVKTSRASISRLRRILRYTPEDRLKSWINNKNKKNPATV